MKKWYLKNKDNINSSIVAWVIVTLGSLVIKSIYSRVSIYNDAIFAKVNWFLNKLYGIKISFLYIIVFIIVYILVLFVKRYKLEMQRKKNEFVILKATYGAHDKEINITNELNNLIEDGKLKTVLSNKIAGDPNIGIVKKGDIKYRYKGEKHDKQYNERDLIELP